MCTCSCDWLLQLLFQTVIWSKEFTSRPFKTHSVTLDIFYHLSEYRGHQGNGEPESLLSPLETHKQIIWSVLSRNSLTDKEEARTDPLQARGFGEHVCDDRKLLYWYFTNVANCPQMLLMWFLNFVEMKDLWPRSPSRDTTCPQLFPGLELS